MSATPAPAPVSPPHPPHPPRSGAQPVGCLPFMVFLLSVACGAGFLSLRCGCLPKEDAWQTVIEILDSPAPAEMKAHVRRITSGEALNRAARNAGEDLPDGKTRGEIQDRMRRNIEVSAEGPFITITAYDNRQSPAEMEKVLAQGYQEYLISEMEDPRRRVAQSLVAHITLGEAATEKARLEWLELARRGDLTPDGASPAETAAGKEIATRLAKAKLDLALAEQRAASLQDKDVDKAVTAAAALPVKEYGSTDLAQYLELKAAAAAPDAPPAAAANLKAARDAWMEELKEIATRLQSEARKHSLEISTLEGALKEQEQNLRTHQQHRSEMDYAKAKYERQLKLLNSLKEESMEQQVKDSVVLRPVRVVDEARPVKVTDRRIRKYVQFGAYASAVLVASLLLCALAGRLCRRGP